MNIRYDTAGRIDRLIEKPAWVVDFLPRQVPADSPGQFFAVEAFWMDGPEMRDLYRRFLRIFLKLNCYCEFDIRHGGCWSHAPSPEALSQAVMRCARTKRDYLAILADGDRALLYLDGGDLYFSVYGPDEGLRGMIAQLAASEGLFFRFGANQDD